MEEDIYLDKLDRRGIKPTAIRLLVIKAMMQAISFTKQRVIIKDFHWWRAMGIR